MGWAAAPPVRVAGVRVRRGGREVLHGVDMTVEAGEIVGLLGPSGCGKTTLMRAMVGVQANVAGTVEILGRPAGDPALRRAVGYVTQAPSVYADLSVRENLGYFAAILGVGDARVAAALETVGLSGMDDHVVATLSGGERSRVSLATALLGEPRVLVLDEPTVGLDPVLRRDLWRRMRSLADAGAALIVSSHVMDEAERCDRLVLMRDGAIIAADRLDELLDRTGTPDAESAFLALVEAASA